MKTEAQKCHTHIELAIECYANYPIKLTTIQNYNNKNMTTGVMQIVPYCYLAESFCKIMSYRVSFM